MKATHQPLHHLWLLLFSPQTQVHSYLCPHSLRRGRQAPRQGSSLARCGTKQPTRIIDDNKRRIFQETGQFSQKNNDSNNELIVDQKFVQRNKCWVVLVDDEESIRMSVGDFLYDEGYKVSACDGADSLLKLLAQTQQQEQDQQQASQTASPSQQQSTSSSMLPHVIVSDVRMPGMDGIELLSVLRNHAHYQRIPVVLLTAKALTGDRILGFKAGADAYLSKPFHPDELLAILDNTIARRQQMKDSQSQLAELQEEMSQIKNIMKQNSANTVKQTNVYLTPAERDVLELVCQGFTNKEIAKRRGVSLDRIIKIITKLFAETKTKNRTELVRWAFQTGYASPRQ